MERLGDLWTLANVAAVLRRRKLDEIDDEDWNVQMDVNVKASFWLSREAGTRWWQPGVAGASSTSLRWPG